MTTYEEFLAGKALAAKAAGFEVSPADINPTLFNWQRDIVRWALRLGRAALFEECGLGKTPQQLEWAKHICQHTGGRVLILAPLAVAHQTVREGAKFGIPVAYCRNQAKADQAAESIIVTNYEMLEHFDAAKFVGVVLDESSILKSFTGKIKRLILETFLDTPYKLACTATPAPNDHLELGNHAEFLGIMPSNEMISRWFINDTMEAGAYRLKKHAEKDFWRWLTSWAVCLSKPSDLGYSDDGFALPALVIHNHIVAVDNTRAFEQGRLFLDANLSATNMWQEKRETARDRAARARAIVDENPDDYWIIWCDTNQEADILKELFPDALEVRGSHSIAIKEERLRTFSEGRAKRIITKPDIAGFGLNWQHCRNQVFVGVTYSFEKLYQALRRSWRFMVEGEVNAHFINAESEGNIMDTIRHKQQAFQEMQHAMNESMAEHGLFRDSAGLSLQSHISEDEAHGDKWTMYLGDCVLTMRQRIPDNSIHFTIFSPPFSTLYIYSDSVADMGNAASNAEFFQQFSYLPPELLRATVPGRLCAVHCKDLPLYMNRDGAAGLADFPGELIRVMESARLDSDPSARWVYHSRVTIWKDPVIEMQRTKNHGLLHRNFTDRAEACRQGMADYLLVFRKWCDNMPDKAVQHDIKPTDADGRPFDYAGENPPVAWDNDDYYSIQVWQRYASPVWFDIDQTNVLNYQIARGDRDEKHICPLQLDVIKRAVQLWTNPGEIVLSTFAGIGSEGYEALLQHRQFIGMELKREYFDWALRYLADAERIANTPTLFSWAEQQQQQAAEDAAAEASE